MENTNITDLPTELLIKIFKHLDLKDLFAMRQQCRYFNKVINSWMHLFVKNDFLVTNQLSEDMKAKSKSQLNILDKIRISANWRNGRYKHKQLTKNVDIVQNVVLDNDCIWLNCDKYIICYEKPQLDRPAKAIYAVGAQEEKLKVNTFIYKQNFIFSGFKDGSVWISTPQQKRVFQCKARDATEITAVDLEGSLCVAGSKNQHCTIWSLNAEDESNMLTFKSRIMLRSSVLCTRFSPGGEYLFVGETVYNSEGNATLINVERQDSVRVLDYYLHFTRRLGIPSVKWETPNILWTCGYDACLRKWDLRKSQCVQRWEDPCKTPIKCFDFDNHCSAITGSLIGNRCILWDTRKQTHFVQMYFTKRDDINTVHNLTFDATDLYTSNDGGINVFNFTDSTQKARCYEVRPISNRLMYLDY